MTRLLRGKISRISLTCHSRCDVPPARLAGAREKFRYEIHSMLVFPGEDGREMADERRGRGTGRGGGGRAAKVAQHAVRCTKYHVGK